MAELLCNKLEAELQCELLELTQRSKASGHYASSLKVLQELEANEREQRTLQVEIEVELEEATGGFDLEHAVKEQRSHHAALFQEHSKRGNAAAAALEHFHHDVVEARALVRAWATQDSNMRAVAEERARRALVNAAKGAAAAAAAAAALSLLRLPAHRAPLHALLSLIDHLRLEARACSAAQLLQVCALDSCQKDLSLGRTRDGSSFDSAQLLQV